MANILLETPLPMVVNAWTYMYPRRANRHPRGRRVAFLKTDMRSRVTHLTDAMTGETWSVPLEGGSYERIVNLITHHSMTAFADIEDGTHRFIYLTDTIRDPKATVFASEQKGILGISLRRGKHYGSIATGASWHREQVGGAYDMAFARDLELLGETTGAGIYDTPAGLGYAVLRRMWEAQQVPHILKLPTDMTSLLLTYSTGGIVTDEGIGRTYPILHEADIRQAYPTVVGLGLPWGTHIYSQADPTQRCRTTGSPAFGYWTLYVTDTIEHSPIPNRDWTGASAGRGETRWDLPIGRYEYAGWVEEIEALRATGKCYAQWQYGWIWHTLSQALKPWVDEMGAYRDRLEHAGHHAAAEYIKLSSNATIGTWSMDPTPIQVVSPDRGAPGDGCYNLPEWCLMGVGNEPPDYVLHRDEAQAKAKPTHWGSFVRMRVRMEIHRLAETIRRTGGTVVSQNFDALQSTTPIHIEDSEFAWKHRVLLEALKPYSRATIAWERNQDGQEHYLQVLPGIPQAARGVTPERTHQYENASELSKSCAD